ncbi:hypothetical protein [Actinacidiphila oryziradicis]|uniref:hypothetical protein n=1 Tax=Actinacidiphila oryziradicis TaxID=2571141 RepID=UPI00145D8D4B|nr:hypothetical protein [Actinacidiphila oryziradicis]
MSRRSARGQRTWSRTLMLISTASRQQWRLLAACHNLRKIFRRTGTAGLVALTG